MQVMVDGSSVRLQIWDTAGQERVRSIAENYYRGAQGVLIAFDVATRRSMLNVKGWLSSIAGHTDNDCDVVLVATKCDLPHDSWVRPLTLGYCESARMMTCACVPADCHQ